MKDFKKMKKYAITVSDQQKYVWFRVAKTGTRSVLHFLNKNSKIKSGFPPRQERRRKLWGYGKTYKPRFDKYFKFTIARNPWDRLLSFYKNKLNTSIIKGSPSFNKFVHRLHKYNLKTCNLHYRLQTQMFPLNKIDYIVRFENLQEDFNIVCDKIGIPHKKLPHKNKTKHEHYTEYYDEETREIVAELYAKDIEYFGYEFGE